MVSLHLATFSKLAEYNVRRCAANAKTLVEFVGRLSLHRSALDSRKLLDRRDDVNYYENEKGPSLTRFRNSVGCTEIISRASESL